MEESIIPFNHEKIPTNISKIKCLSFSTFQAWTVKTMHLHNIGPWTYQTQMDFQARSHPTLIIMVKLCFLFLLHLQMSEKLRIFLKHTISKAGSTTVFYTNWVDGTIAIHFLLARDITPKPSWMHREEYISFPLHILLNQNLRNMISINLLLFTNSIPKTELPFTYLSSHIIFLTDLSILTISPFKV